MLHCRITLPEIRPEAGPGRPFAGSQAMIRALHPGCCICTLPQDETDPPSGC